MRKDLVAFHNDIIGLARLVPGQVFQDSVRTVWNEQERLGWQLIRCTDDAFSVSVTACAVAKDTIAMSFEHDYACSSFAHGRSFQLLSHASCAMVREARFLEPGGTSYIGRRGEDLAREWGFDPAKMLCVTLPTRLAFCVALGSWHSLVFLHRKPDIATGCFHCGHQQISCEGHAAGDTH